MTLTSSCYPPSWVHVVKPSSRFDLYTLDNIPLVLLHGSSNTELTFNSDYCCRRFLVEPSRTSLFFEQCLLLYSSVVTAWYHLWKLPSSHFSLLCEIRCSSYTSVHSSGTKCLTPKLPMALPVFKLLKILTKTTRSRWRSRRQLVLVLETTMVKLLRPCRSKWPKWRLQCAMLLHCIGIEAMRIFNGMQFRRMWR